VDQADGPCALRDMIKSVPGQSAAADRAGQERKEVVAAKLTLLGCRKLRVDSEPLAAGIRARRFVSEDFLFVLALRDQLLHFVPDALIMSA